MIFILNSYLTSNQWNENSECLSLIVVFLLISILFLTYIFGLNKNNYSIRMKWLNDFNYVVLSANQWRDRSTQKAYTSKIWSNWFRKRKKNKPESICLYDWCKLRLCRMLNGQTEWSVQITHTHTHLTSVPCNWWLWGHLLDNVYPSTDCQAVRDIPKLQTNKTKQKEVEKNHFTCHLIYYDRWSSYNFKL